MSMSRADLIEYLCSQQHAARMVALALSGVTQTGVPFASLSTAIKQTERASMATVLEELESLGMLREKTPAT